VWHAANAVVETLLGAEILLVPSAPCVRVPSAGPASLSQWQTITRGTAFLQTAYLVMAARVGEANGNISWEVRTLFLPRGKSSASCPFSRRHWFKCA